MKKNKDKVVVVGNPEPESWIRQAIGIDVGRGEKTRTFVIYVDPVIRTDFDHRYNEFHARIESGIGINRNYTIRNEILERDGYDKAIRDLLEKDLSRLRAHRELEITEESTTAVADGSATTMTSDMLQAAIRTIAGCYVRRDTMMRAREVVERRHAFEMMRHHLLDGMAGLSGPKSKPESAVEITWLREKLIPKDIDYRASDDKIFTARLLDDTLKLWEESQRMDHCLYRSYTEKINAGGYIAYHIDAPHLRDNGFTLGLKRKKPRGWYGLSPDMFTIDGEYHPEKPGRGDLWAIDQLKGRKNSTLHDDDLQYFCDLITGEVNKIMQNHGTKQ